jgi:hypothetical protein
LFFLSWQRLAVLHSCSLAILAQDANSLYDLRSYVPTFLEVKEQDVAETKTIPVTGRGDPCFLDNRLIDGDEVVSLKCRPSFTPKKIPGTQFC